MTMGPEREGESEDTVDFVAVFGTAGLSLSSAIHSRWIRLGKPHHLRVS